MVIDEAHTLKNPDSNAYQNIDKLETSHRLLLTGTPVQNSPKELMSLICFLMPFFKSGNKTGWEDDEGKKNDGGLSMLEYFVSLEKKGKGGESSDEAIYRKLKQLFAPFVLRRKKEDVLSQSMPPKVSLTPKWTECDHFKCISMFSHSIQRHVKFCEFHYPFP
jgi:SNF2 family DNA or RNA helicase